MINNISFGASLNINTNNDKNALNKKSIKHLTNLAKDIEGDVIEITIDKGELKTKGQKPKIVHNLKLVQGKFVSEHKDLPFKTNLTEVIEKIFDILKARAEDKSATTKVKNNVLHAKKSAVKNDSAETDKSLTKTQPDIVKDFKTVETEAERLENQRKIEQEKVLEEKIAYIKKLEKDPNNCKLKLNFNYDKELLRYGEDPGNFFHKLSLEQLKSLAEIINTIPDKSATVTINIQGASQAYYKDKQDLYSYIAKINHDIYNTPDNSVCLKHEYTVDIIKKGFINNWMQYDEEAMQKQECEENNKLFNEIKSALKEISEDFSMKGLDTSSDPKTQLGRAFYEIKQLQKQNAELREDNKNLKKDINSLKERVKFLDKKYEELYWERG